MYNDEEEFEEKKKFADETIIYKMNNDIEEVAYGSEDNIVRKDSRKNPNKSKIIIGILVVVTIIAIIIGILLSSKKTNNNENSPVNSVEQKIENQSKKIDETKLWVYDANYNEEATDKKKSNQYSTKKDLIMPYININSSDAEKVNKEIKSVFDNLYSGFGDEGIVYSSNYKFYENGNILSIVIVTNEIIINGGATELDCYTYNFNLDTLKQIGIEEISPKCGFKSANEALSKIREWENKQVDYIEKNPAMVAATFEGVEDGKYFIDEKGKLNFIYATLAGGKSYVFTVVEKDKEIKDMYESNNIEHVEQMSKEDIDNSKKINRDMPFVYNANYSDNVQEKNINNNNSKKDLVIPYININSSEVELINSKLKSIFTDLYNKYGNNDTVYNSKYKFYENGNVLSIVFETYSTVINGSSSQLDCYVYNIDLESLKEINKDKLCTICGFKSASEVTNKLVDWEDEQKELIRENPNKFTGTFDGVEKGKYFIGENGKLNFVYVTKQGGKTFQKSTIEPNKEINVNLIK